MKLMNFYRAIFSAGNLIADDEGRVSFSVKKDQSAPYTVGGKRLVLPTKEYLAQEDKSMIAMFHPLSENILRGESEVMVRFRSSVNTTLNYRFGLLVSQLLVLGGSPAMHNRLKPDQMELMSILKEADEKTLTNFGALIKAMPLDSTDKCFVHFYIKRNGQINGKAHRRVCVITFPFYDVLAGSEGTVYGVKLRKKDHAMLKGMMEHLLPNLDKPGYYNQGSTSDSSPTVEALMRGVLSVASHINSIIEEFGDILPEIKELSYDDAWVEPLDNVDQFAAEVRMIPMQNGNEGTHETKPTHAPSAPPPLQNVAPPPVAAPMHAPHAYAHHHVAPPVHAAPPTMEGMDFATKLRMLGNNGMQPQGYGGPMGYGHPNQGYPGGMPYGHQMSGPEAARNQQIPAYERSGYGQPQQFGNYPQQQNYGGYPQGYDPNIRI